jgi:hypothetical protein
VLGGDVALSILQSVRYASVLDVSKVSFWVWFLPLAGYINTSRAGPEALISSVWKDSYETYHLRHEFGAFLRDGCLKKLFRMDHKLHNLLDDPSLPMSEAE